MSLLHTAEKYTASGLSVIPCKQKRPVIGSWSQFQEKQPAGEELSHMFAKGADQIAIICGAVSGNLEVIDVDLKNDESGELWDLLWNDILAYFNNAMPLLVVFTPSGGAHLYYRCSEVAGNQKLASKLKDGRPVVLIETRGEGGYVIAPPSDGYRFADNGKDLTHIKAITADQRADVLDICRKYNQVFKTEKAKVSNVQASAYAVTPWDQYNNDTSDPWQKVLEDAGWFTTYAKDGRVYFSKAGSDSKNKANWSEEKRLFYVFSTSTEFDSEKAYTPFAIYAVIRCGGDFSQATRELREQGYGKPFTEKEEDLINKASGLVDKGLDPFDIIRMLTPDFFEQFPEVKDLPKQERDEKAGKALDTIVNAASERHAQSKGLFWKVGKKESVIIFEYGLKEFLINAGFRLFVQERGSMLYRLVYMDQASRVIEEYPVDMMKKWVEQWIVENIDDYQVNRMNLLEAFVKFRQWGSIIELIPRIGLAEVSFLRDTKRASFIPFQNGIVHITKDDIRMMQYHELPANMFLWRSQIKNEVIDLLAINNELELNQCPVYRFIKRISGIMPDIEHLPLDELRKSYPELHSRFIAFLSSGGYLMSNYKDPGKQEAVVLAEDTASDKDGGGAGKDLLMKVFSKLRPMCVFLGKLWRPTASFAFQTYKFGDDILYISDIPENFKLHQFYNIITEGLPIEKKNKDAFVVSYELSPKVAFSTNYDVDVSSEHAGRRIIKLLLNKYYNKQRKPEHELGGQFWSPEWTHQDWMLFYLLLFTMIQIHLDGGSTEFATTENMKAKSIKLKCEEEFYEFMTGWLEHNIGKWKSKTILYEEFLDDTGMEKKEYSSHRFTRSLQFYANAMGMQFENKKNWERKNGERSQNFVIFTKQGEELPKLDAGTPF